MTETESNQAPTSQAGGGDLDTSIQAGGTDPDTSVTVVVGIVGAILVFVIIVALQALFYDCESQTVSRINRGDPRLLSRVRAEQLESINSYGWKDRQKGVVTIPIDKAMELVVKDLAEGEPPRGVDTAGEEQ